MPIVMVNVKDGRSLEQKRAMITGITNVLCETMEVPAAAVRIVVNEMRNEDFAIGGVLICDNPSKQVKKRQ